MILIIVLQEAILGTLAIGIAGLAQVPPEAGSGLTDMLGICLNCRIFAEAVAGLWQQVMEDLRQRIRCNGENQRQLISNCIS